MRITTRQPIWSFCPKLEACFHMHCQDDVVEDQEDPQRLLRSPALASMGQRLVQVTLNSSHPVCHTQVASYHAHVSWSRIKPSCQSLACCYLGMIAKTLLSSLVVPLHLELQSERSSHATCSLALASGRTTNNYHDSRLPAMDQSHARETTVLMSPHVKQIP